MMIVDMTKYPCTNIPLTSSSGNYTLYTGSTTILPVQPPAPFLLELTDSSKQAIREIIREELAKQLQDDDDDVPMVRVPLDGFPSMTVEFTHDGKIYKGMAYVVEVDE
jgi:hypothetical protein